MQGQYESNEFLIYSVYNTSIFLIKLIIVESAVSPFSTSAQIKNKSGAILKKKKKCYNDGKRDYSLKTKLSTKLIFNLFPLPGTGWGC